MAQQIEFKKATRHAVKLKIGVDGPSGSGKTKGALALATGITSGGRIAVADSENESASYYSNEYAFDGFNITEKTPETYIAAIRAAAEAKYDALVMDSLSHGWFSVLAAKEDYDRKNPKSNSWTNWRMFGPRWDALMSEILNAPLHVIVTMRSKQAYEQVESNGRKQVIKLGLKPEVRDGSEYELGVVFSVEHNHLAEATKDRTGLFTGRQLDLCSPALHAELIAWMNTGGELKPVQKVRDEAGENVLRGLLADEEITADERAKMDFWLTEVRTQAELLKACERIDGLIVKRRAAKAAAKDDSTAAA